MKNKLLITYFFPPNNAVASLRTNVFAAILNKHGLLFGVVTIKPNRLLKKDLISNIDEKIIFRTEFSDYSNIEDFVLGNKSYYNIFRNILKKVYIPDGKILWFPSLFNKVKSIIKDNTIDLIIVSAGPFTAVLVCYFIKKFYKIPYIVDMRDPWADNPLNKKFFPFNYINKLLEYYCLKNASAITTVSEPICEIYKKKYMENSYTIYNGYIDSSDSLKDYKGKKKEFHIVYTGQLYTERSLKDFSIAINNILETDWGINIIVNIYGSRIAESVKKELSIIPKKNIILHGQCTHQESLRYQAQADLLLFPQMQGKNFNGHLSGKIFEYLQSGSDILSYGDDQGTSKFLLDEFGIVSCRNVEEIEILIKNKIKSKLDNNYYKNRNNYPNLGKYNRYRQAEKLIEIINCKI